MKNAEFTKLINSFFTEKCLDILCKKGREYQNNVDGEVFANFERTANITGLSREQVALVFLNKHLDSINKCLVDINIAKTIDDKQNVLNKMTEPFELRIADAINYLLLLYGMVSEYDKKNLSKQISGVLSRIPDTDVLNRTDSEIESSDLIFKNDKKSNLPSWFTNNLKNGNISEVKYTVNNGILTWEDGTWHTGYWGRGIWEGGTWKGGTWFDGTWYNGNWVGGIWNGGIWERGWIYDPERKGNYKKDWKWEGDYVYSRISPREYFGQEQSPKGPNNDLDKDKLPSWFTNNLKNGNISEDAVYMMNNEDSLTWKNGTWKDGLWEGGIWGDNTWENGLWKGGTWYNGTWKGGNWEKGWWQDGTWIRGWWKDGNWKNGWWKNGTWKDGFWEGGWIYDPEKKGNHKEDWEWRDDYVRSPISPKEYFGQETSPYTKPDVNKDKLPSWFNINLKKGNISEDAVYTMNMDRLIWERGTWLGGTWKSGTWKQGRWMDGTWETGIWLGGTWEDGIWNGGTWKGGRWNSGTWKGIWKGSTWQNGVWEDGWWNGGTWEGGGWLGGWIYDPKRKGNCNKDSMWTSTGDYVYSKVSPEKYFGLFN